ncbi:hypothetical protein STEG23_030631 [Scotinomys teguina]
MVLAEEISKHPSMDSVMWLLVITFIEIYNEKEKVEQGKIQNVQFEEKMSTRKYNGAKSSVQGDKMFKEKPDANVLKVVVTSGQEPTQPLALTRSTAAKELSTTLLCKSKIEPLGQNDLQHKRKKNARKWNLVKTSTLAFAYLGVPNLIKTDNGPAYASQGFQKFCKRWSIQHKTGIPYNPQDAERPMWLPEHCVRPVDVPADTKDHEDDPDSTNIGTGAMDVVELCMPHMDSLADDKPQLRKIIMELRAEDEA